MDAAEISELFAPFGPVSVRRMFGGHGIYVDGLCFAIHVRGEIFLKADAVNRAAFEAAGSTPFSYEHSGKRVSLGYWRLTEAAFDEPDTLREWSETALAAARRAAAAKAPKRDAKPGVGARARGKTTSRPKPPDGSR